MANSEARMSSDVAPTLEGEYDVFLNFRGADTRHDFTSFLNDYLVNAKVRVFMDENEIDAGDVIGKNIRHAINNSVIYITVFSPTYADSKWCLRELAQMVENVSNSEGKKSILPIFFHVNPKDLKLRTPVYSDAFQKHKEECPDEVEAWRNALAVVDEIKGWKVTKDQRQSQVTIVESIVKKVSEMLETKRKSVTEHLVGLDDRVKEMTELLDVNQLDVRLIQIYGMDGMGKTTIAKFIFRKISSHFGKHCSFLENVRESSLTVEGIVQLQNKLLSEVAGSPSVEKVKDIEQGTRTIEEMLCTKKVLVVLDDVDNEELIRKLIGNSSLHLGSRIIITTKDIGVLQVKGFKGNILSYEMRKMDDGPALQLFCRHAFGGDVPSNDYDKLSSEIVSKTGGIPLAIKVISSFLNGKDRAFWKVTLANLKNAPKEEILKQLRISYDDLDENQKQIFLDIACFFVNENKTDAIYVWDDCNFDARRAIDALTKRCLIKILDNDEFWMHNQLIALGRKIVRENNSNDLGKQSRLWIAKEALEIIRTKEKKDKVRSLQIDGWNGSIEITSEEFERLPNLRFLKLSNGTYVGDFTRCCSNLRYISWCPLRQDFRATSMYLDHLVFFKLGMNGFMDDSKAWDLFKMARNLKVLSLIECYGITKIPDFSSCLLLERLTLARCKRLKRIESFIGDLFSLIELKIEGCKALTDLPEEIGALAKLKCFSLSGCSKLRELPSSLGNLTSLIELDLSRTGITKLPNSINELVKLESFLLTDTRIRELPNSIETLKSLCVLHFSRKGSCSQEHHVWQLPSGLSMLENLEELDLSGHDGLEGEVPLGIQELSFLRILNLEQTRICRIPRTINMLRQLQTLNLRYCHEIEELPELPTSLTHLLIQSDSLLFVPNLLNLTNLVELLLSHGSTLTRCNLRWIGRLSRLKRLELNLPNVPVPPELASLSQLEELTLSHLYLGNLVQLPSSLLRLYLQFFSIKCAELVPSLGSRNLLTLEFSFCEVEEIPLDGLPQLENLTVCGCKLLQRLSIPLELRKLRQVHVSSCPELVEIQIEGPLTPLEIFFIFRCKSLRRIGGLSY